MTKPELHTLDEIAQLLRKSNRTILRYESQGVIPSRLDLPGRQALWLRQDIVDFVLATKKKNKGGSKLGAPSKNRNRKQSRLVDLFDGEAT